ncbi:MAG: hypothetical protein AAFX87_30650 [Bacteroidota bacterium]
MRKLIRTYSLASLICIIAMITMSCEEQDNSYSGPPVVEFQRSITGVTAQYSSGVGTVIDTAIVQLVGPHQTSDMNLTFSVENSSSAVEGTHFNLLSPGTFVIEQGSSFGYIRFEVLTDNVTSGENFQLDLTLTGGDLDVSENYKTLAHRLNFQ